MTDMITDVAIIGSGAAGLSTAIVAAQSGLEVTVLEKAQYFGGTTSYSGGGVWIPFNRLMSQSGVDDDLTQAETYLRGVMANYYDEDKVGAYLQNANRMMEYFEDRTEVSFTWTGMPDYEPGVEGWKMGRCVSACPYDGRRLGPHLKTLRQPPAHFGVLGMQVWGGDLPRLMNATKSPRDALFAAGLFLSAFRDRLLYGRSTRLTNGNALAARLLRTAIDTNVKLWSGTPAVEIQPGPDRQWRVTIEKDGQRRTLVARRALVIASGGFGSDPTMSERYIPMAADGYTLQPSENRGDGIRMGVAAGAVFEPHLVANAIGTPIYAMPGPDGTPLVFPSLLIDRYGPGSIIVNQAGKRFVDESSHYHRFMAEMNVHKTPIAYLIANHAFRRRYGLGMSKPAPLPIGKYLRNGHLVSARTLPELAAKLDIDPTVLAETVKRFDGNASRGVDPDFNRGGNAYSTFLGDQRHKPNPCLGPVGEGPYFAVRIYPGNYSTLAGLETNASAQILDAKGDPIAGLYAVGIDMAPVFKGTYPGGGTSLGPALTFGYIAANHIVSAAGQP